jgi:hypothetical protein
VNEKLINYLRNRFEFLTTATTHNVCVWNGKMFACLGQKVAVSLKRYSVVTHTMASGPAEQESLVFARYWIC